MHTHEEINTTNATAAVLRRLALQASGMTGADIARIIREARQKARREKRTLSHSDLAAVLARSRPVRSPSMRRRIAVHESGHILVRLIHGLGEITFVTIDGRDGHGYVESTADDALIQTEDGLTRLVQVFLAGRAAEQVTYGNALAGSGGSERSDLARATHLAYLMEASIGYGTTTPLLYRDPDERAAELRLDPDLAERVNCRLEDAYSAVGDILRRHRPVLRYLSDVLILHGTLEGADLSAMLAEARIKLLERLHSARPEGADTEAPDDSDRN
jgi:cell division protease FtsH